MAVPQLIVPRPLGKIDRFALLQPMTIGRAPGNNIRFVDRGVSRWHARIGPRDTGWFVVDLGSRNGTLVNGEEIGERPHGLNEGDVVTVGDMELIYSERNETTTLEETGLVVVMSAVQEKGEFPSATKLETYQLTQEYEKLRIAHQLQLRIGVQSDVRTLLEDILAFCFEVFPGERGAIYRYDPVNDVFALLCHRNHFQLGRSILRRVVKDRRAILIEDAKTDKRYQIEGTAGGGVRSLLAVPFLVNGEVHSVLVLDNRTMVGAFGEHDVQLLLGISAQTSLAIEHTALIQEFQKAQETKLSLSRFLSPELAQQVMNGTLEMNRGGELRDVSILYSDVRGFTSYVETEGPEETVRMLNRYFEIMVECVFEHGGTLDKFVGDALMATWGAVQPDPDARSKALACAVDQMSRLAVLNEERAAANKKAIGIGIGLAAGPVIAGLIGSPHRLEYTVIGDAVNIAARLQSIAKEGEIVAQREMVQSLEARYLWNELPPIQVKGISKALSVVEILGPRKRRPPRKKRRTLILRR